MKKGIRLIIMILFVVITAILVITMEQSKSSNQEPNIEWQKWLGGRYVDEAYSIQQTNDGGYIVAGYTWFNYGYSDYLIVKLEK